MSKELEKWTERDWKMARVIYEEQFLPFSIIRDYYFYGDKSNATRRLKILFQKKLIRLELVGVLQKMRVIRLTKKGISFFKEKFPIEVKQKRNVTPATLDHDLFVIEARLQFAKRFESEWIPERAMKAKGLEKIPDGILTISEKRIAIEVENTIKSKARYEAIWREWEGKGFMLILYVSTQESVHRALLKNMKEFKTNSYCLGLMPFSDFKKEDLVNVWTPSGELGLFSMRTS